MIFPHEKVGVSAAFRRYMENGLDAVSAGKTYLKKQFTPLRGSFDLVINFTRIKTTIKEITFENCYFRRVHVILRSSMKTEYSPTALTVHRSNFGKIDFSF